MAAGPPSRRRVYSARPWHRDYFAVRHVGEFLRAQLAELVRRDTRVLDVGCGEQPLRETIEELGGRYVGVDLARGGGEQIVGSVLALPVRTAAVDLVVCSEVLEHVPDTERAFAELARVTRPGGRLVITVPFAYPLHEEPHDFVRLTPYELERAAAAHGLEVLVLRRLGHEFEVMATALDDLLVRSLPARPSRVRRAFGAAVRTAANVMAMGASSVARSATPRSFATVAAVLRRPG